MQVRKYNAFSDIEFNPEKSINGQARVVAIICGLMQAGILEEAMKSQRDYMNVVYHIRDNDITECKQLSFL